jgi:hypothetical protein
MNLFEQAFSSLFNLLRELKVTLTIRDSVQIRKRDTFLQVRIRIRNSLKLLIRRLVPIMRIYPLPFPRSFINNHLLVLEYTRSGMV